MIATCRSCGASIVWAITANGKKIPIDEKPSQGGNVMLLPPQDPRDGPVAVIISAKSTLPRETMHPTYRSHFATCPDAGRHRK